MNLWTSHLSSNRFFPILHLTNVVLVEDPAMETLLESLRERKSVGGAAAVAWDAVQEAPRAAAAVSRPNDLFASDGRRLFENIPANRKEQIL